MHVSERLSGSKHVCLRTAGLAVASAISVGDKIPADVEIHHGFPPKGGLVLDLATYLAGKKVILMGLPGAFTPT